MKLRPLVQKFAEEMEKRLRANDHKNGLFEDEMEIQFRIQEEMEEVNASIIENGIASVEECADVANFCAMLAGYGRPIPDWPPVNWQAAKETK